MFKRFSVFLIVVLLHANILFAQQPVKGIANENGRIEAILSTDWTFNYFPEGFKIPGKYPGYSDNRWNQPDANHLEYNS